MLKSNRTLLRLRKLYDIGLRAPTIRKIGRYSNSIVSSSYISYAPKVGCTAWSFRSLSNETTLSKDQKKDGAKQETQAKGAPSDIIATQPSVLSSSPTTQLKITSSKGSLLITATMQDSMMNDIIVEKVEIAAENKGGPNNKLSKADGGSAAERKFITPCRALSDFLLKPSDLEDLPQIKRRSPYEQAPAITVYWRKDVENKALKIWGSMENLLNELMKRDADRKHHQQHVFITKRRLRDYRREMGSRVNTPTDDPGLLGQSGRVVLIAVAINMTNLIFKTFAWLNSGSHSMFAEVIHSFADTVNQLILVYGIHKSTQDADPAHPYGYTNMKYVSSLISGVAIFCVGSGLSISHGILGLLHPEPMENLFWSFVVLTLSMLSEGFTLAVAVNKIRKSAKEQGISFKEYVMRGQDPSVNVVLTEDAAAVTSVILATGCMSITSLTGSTIPDAIGSLLVGGILGGVASFIIYTNVAALVGKSIPEEQLDKINAELESDIMIRAIHDVKGIDMGNSLVRYKAEMDFDGRELTRVYLEKQDLSELLKAVKSFKTIDELQEFMLSHGENIVDLMGGEIDRIEMNLRNKFPEIRHCDLEIL